MKNIILRATKALVRVLEGTPQTDIKNIPDVSSAENTSDKGHRTDASGSQEDHAKNGGMHFGDKFDIQAQEIEDSLWWIRLMIMHLHTTDKTDSENLCLQYLEDITSETNRLPWASVDPEYADPERGESPGLADVYTALDTTEIGRPETEDEVRRYLLVQHRRGRISAQAMLNSEEKVLQICRPYRA